MNLTINCTRVPIPRGTIFDGMPLEIGPAPVTQGLESDHVSSIGTNDGAPLNPPGRGTPDGDEERPPPPPTPTNSKLLKCNRKTILSTFNVRTLGPKGRLDELEQCAQASAIDIIAVQEHRFHHPDDPIQYKSIGKYQLVTSSGTKNACNATIGGVGFLLSSKAMDNLLNVESISPRIMVLELKGNPKITIVCGYSPTNEAPEEDIEEFYSSLRSVLENVPQHNFLCVLGDMNAKIGPEDASFTFDYATNRNGEMLLDFMDEFNLFSSNNLFMKPKNQLWSFEYPSGRRSQLDYVIFRKKWRNSVRDSRSYSSFSTVGSDHRIVSASIKLSLRSSKKSPPHPMKTIDWRSVSQDKDLSARYSIAVHNKFQILSSNSELELGNIDDIYSNLSSATIETATEMLPKKKSAARRPASTTIIVSEARERLKHASLAYHAKPSMLKKVALTTSKKELDNAYLQAEADYISGKIADIKHLHITKQHSAAWKSISEISGKASKPAIRLKGGSSDARMSNWSEHFRNLLGKEPTTPTTHSLPRTKISDPLDIPTHPFTINELTTVLKSIKPAKAFGPDNIPAIVWKDPIFHSLLLKLCDFCLLDNQCPLPWRTSQIIPVPKKGDLSLASNYRGISLLPIAAKIYNRLILNRLLPFVEPLLRNNQNGFRAGRSTLSQILALRRIIEETKLCNLDAVFIFVDFSKAFDSVDRSLMLEILALYGIPEQLIKAIQVLYTNTTATIYTPDGETQPIDIKAGILQGDTLAPFLFILVVDYILRMSVDQIPDKGLEVQPRRSSRYPARHLTDADFADDLALISGSLANAQSLLSSLEKAANCVGLYLNESKTEYLNHCQIIDSDFSIKTINGRELKCVQDYKYLGSFISDSVKDFKTRKGMAWSACNDLHNVWSSSLDDKIKINTFKTMIEPILLYGSETWTLNARQQKRLDGTYTRLLMRVKNLSWKRHPTLQTIYGDLPRVSQVVRTRRVRFAGHCFRATNEIVSPLILWKPQSIGRKSRKLTYPDVIARDSGIRFEDLAVAMQDRNIWRDIVGSISTAVER